MWALLVPDDIFFTYSHSSRMSMTTNSAFLSTFSHLLFFAPTSNPGNTTNYNYNYNYKCNYNYNTTNTQNRRHKKRNDFLSDR